MTTDDLLAAHPERVPARPRVGIAPMISDAELLTLAVMQALLGYTSETRWWRYARKNLLGMFPALPRQQGYNKRLRKLADTMTWLISALGQQTSIADDDVWVIDTAGIELLRPARKGEKPRAGQRFFKPLRQVIESINDTFKGQLDLELHDAKAIASASPSSAP